MSVPWVTERDVASRLEHRAPSCHEVQRGAATECRDGRTCSHSPSRSLGALLTAPETNDGNGLHLGFRQSDERAPARRLVKALHPRLPQKRCAAELDLAAAAAGATVVATELEGHDPAPSSVVHPDVGLDRSPQPQLHRWS